MGWYDQRVRWFALLFAAAGLLRGQSAENVLIVVNRNDAASLEIGEYYRLKRNVPKANVCALQTTAAEEIDRATYDALIEKLVGGCLKNGLTEKILYLVTTLGVPLKIRGAGSRLQSESSSVDSELALLYGRLHGATYPVAGPVYNPFFGRREARFEHSRFPIYLVTRLAAYDVAEAKALVDRALAARNVGKFVIDTKVGRDDGAGDEWLRTAAILLPADRAILEESKRVVYGAKEVIAYASWGSNDPSRTQRWLGFQWLPGAIATEFVSTNGRTFKRPPDDWNITTWQDSSHFWAGSPQTLAADLIHEGATGASGNVYEPFLQGCARPDYVLPAYYQGRNLAESFYLGLPYLSWMGIVVGDPLTTLRK